MIENKFYELGDKNILIALITDLHFDDNYNLNLLDKIIKNLNDHKPNYIGLSGDIIDYADMIESENIENLRRFVKQLSLIASTIVTLGNHDITDKFERNSFDKVNKWFLTLNTIENVYYLNNKSLVRDKICFTSYNPSLEYYHNLRGKEQLNYFINSR